jgi:hypothetical protein
MTRAELLYWAAVLIYWQPRRTPDRSPSCPDFCGMAVLRDEIVSLFPSFGPSPDRSGYHDLC